MKNTCCWSLFSNRKAHVKAPPPTKEQHTYTRRQNDWVVVVRCVCVCVCPCSRSLFWLFYDGHRDCSASVLSLCFVKLCCFVVALEFCVTLWWPRVSAVVLCVMLSIKICRPTFGPPAHLYNVTVRMLCTDTYCRLHWAL